MCVYMCVSAVLLCQPHGCQRFLSAVSITHCPLGPGLVYRQTAGFGWGCTAATKASLQPVRSLSCHQPTIVHPFKLLLVRANCADPQFEHYHGGCGPNMHSCVVQVGAKVLLDCCQSVPHMPVDVQQLGADWIVASSHKMCGPTGIGILWGRYEQPAQHVRACSWRATSLAM